MDNERNFLVFLEYLSPGADVSLRVYERFNLLRDRRTRRNRALRCLDVSCSQSRHRTDIISVCRLFPPGVRVFPKRAGNAASLESFFCGEAGVGPIESSDFALFAPQPGAFFICLNIFFRIS